MDSASPERAGHEPAFAEYAAERLAWLEHRLLRLVAVERGLEGEVELSARAAVLAQRVRALESADPSLPTCQLRARGLLSPFQEDVLWLAAGAGLDRHLGELVADLQNDARRDFVTPWVCLRLFCETRRERVAAAASFEPGSPLVDLGLVSSEPRDVSPHNRLDRELVAAPFAVAFLLGRPTLGGALASIARLGRPRLRVDDIALHAADRQGLRAMLAATHPHPALDDACTGPEHYDFQRAVLLLITGSPGSGKTLAARALAAEAGATVIEVDADRAAGLPPLEAAAATEQAFRAGAFAGTWLLFDGCGHLLRDVAPENPFLDVRAVHATFRAALDRYPVTVIVTADSPDQLAGPVRERVLRYIELRPPTATLCSEIWGLNVPAQVDLAMDVDFRRLAGAHALSGRRIQNALHLAVRAATGRELTAEGLHQAAAVQQLPGLGEVARRTWVTRTPEDLVLPAATRRQIDDIVATERVRESVLQASGLAGRMQKGLGLCCLFDGEPGTGKTLAAELVASQLDAPLFTVNVANVVSKWIGETEKNLQRVFDEAQKNRCVLLFDEADTLFSKRTEVSRAVDRYSNMEVGLLLQLVEGHRGLVILTTNLKETIDAAFSRRFTFKVNFPFPEADIRERIWARLLPEDRLAESVDVAALARNYELSGGSIRTVVLRAVYRAAVAGTRVTMEILGAVATDECRALGKLVRERVNGGG